MLPRDTGSWYTVPADTSSAEGNRSRLMSSLFSSSFLSSSPSSHNSGPLSLSIGNAAPTSSLLADLPGDVHRQVSPSSADGGGVGATLLSPHEVELLSNRRSHTTDVDVVPFSSPYYYSSSSSPPPFLHRSQQSQTESEHLVVRSPESTTTAVILRSFLDMDSISDEGICRRRRMRVGEDPPSPNQRPSRCKSPLDTAPSSSFHCAARRSINKVVFVEKTQVARDTVAAKMLVSRTAPLSFSLVHGAQHNGAINNSSKNKNKNKNNNTTRHIMVKASYGQSHPPLHCCGRPTTDYAIGVELLLSCGSCSRERSDNRCDRKHLPHHRQHHQEVQPYYYYYMCAHPQQDHEQREEDSRERDKPADITNNTATLTTCTHTNSSSQRDVLNVANRNKKFVVRQAVEYLPSLDDSSRSDRLFPLPSLPLAVVRSYFAALKNNKRNNKYVVVNSGSDSLQRESTSRAALINDGERRRLFTVTTNFLPLSATAAQNKLHLNRSGHQNSLFLAYLYSLSGGGPNIRGGESEDDEGEELEEEEADEEVEDTQGDGDEGDGRRRVARARARLRAARDYRTEERREKRKKRWRGFVGHQQRMDSCCFILHSISSSPASMSCSLSFAMGASGRKRRRMTRRKGEGEEKVVRVAGWGYLAAYEHIDDTTSSSSYSSSSVSDLSDHEEGPKGAGQSATANPQVSPSDESNNNNNSNNSDDQNYDPSAHYLVEDTHRPLHRNVLYLASDEALEKCKKRQQQLIDNDGEEEEDRSDRDHHRNTNNNTNNSNTSPFGFRLHSTNAINIRSNTNTNANANANTNLSSSLSNTTTTAPTAAAASRRIVEPSAPLNAVDLTATTTNGLCLGIVSADGYRIAATVSNPITVVSKGGCGTFELRRCGSDMINTLQFYWAPPPLPPPPPPTPSSRSKQVVDSTDDVVHDDKKMGDAKRKGKLSLSHKKKKRRRSNDNDNLAIINNDNDTDNNHNTYDGTDSAAAAQSRISGRGEVEEDIALRRLSLMVAAMGETASGNRRRTGRGGIRGRYAGRDEGSVGTDEADDGADDVDVDEDYAINANNNDGNADDNSNNVNNELHDLLRSLFTRLGVGAGVDDGDEGDNDRNDESGEENEEDYEDRLREDDSSSNERSDDSDHSSTGTDTKSSTSGSGSTSGTSPTRRPHGPLVFSSSSAQSRGLLGPSFAGPQRHRDEVVNGATSTTSKAADRDNRNRGGATNNTAATANKSTRGHTLGIGENHNMPVSNSEALFIFSGSNEGRIFEHRLGPSFFRFDDACRLHRQWEQHEEAARSLKNLLRKGRVGPSIAPTPEMPPSRDNIRRSYADAARDEVGNRSPTTSFVTNARAAHVNHLFSSSTSDDEEDEDEDDDAAENEPLLNTNSGSYANTIDEHLGHQEQQQEGEEGRNIFRVHNRSVSDRKARRIERMKKYVRSLASTRPKVPMRVLFSSNTSINDLIMLRPRPPYSPSSLSSFSTSSPSSSFSSFSYSPPPPTCCAFSLIALCDAFFFLTFSASDPVWTRRSHLVQMRKIAYGAFVYKHRFEYLTKEEYLNVKEEEAVLAELRRAREKALKVSGHVPSLHIGARLHEEHEKRGTAQQKSGVFYGEDIEENDSVAVDGDGGSARRPTTTSCNDNNNNNIKKKRETSIVNIEELTRGLQAIRLRSSFTLAGGSSRSRRCPTRARGSADEDHNDDDDNDEDGEEDDDEDEEEAYMRSHRLQLENVRGPEQVSLRIYASLKSAKHHRSNTLVELCRRPPLPPISYIQHDNDDIGVARSPRHQQGAAVVIGKKKIGLSGSSIGSTSNRTTTSCSAYLPPSINTGTMNTNTTTIIRTRDLPEPYDVSYRKMNPEYRQRQLDRLLTRHPQQQRGGGGALRMGHANNTAGNTCTNHNDAAKTSFSVTRYPYKQLRVSKTPVPLDLQLFFTYGAVSLDGVFLATSSDEDYMVCGFFTSDLLRSTIAGEMGEALKPKTSGTSATPSFYDTRGTRGEATETDTTNRFPDSSAGQTAAPCWLYQCQHRPRRVLSIGDRTFVIGTEHSVVVLEIEWEDDDDDEDDRGGSSSSGKRYPQVLSTVPFTCDLSPILTQCSRRRKQRSKQYNNNNKSKKRTAAHMSFDEGEYEDEDEVDHDADDDAYVEDAESAGEQNARANSGFCSNPDDDDDDSEEDDLEEDDEEKLQKRHQKMERIVGIAVDPKEEYISVVTTRRRVKIHCAEEWRRRRSGSVRYEAPTSSSSSGVATTTAAESVESAATNAGLQHHFSSSSSSTASSPLKRALSSYITEKSLRAISAELQHLRHKLAKEQRRENTFVLRTDTIRRGGEKEEERVLQRGEKEAARERRVALLVNIQRNIARLEREQQVTRSILFHYASLNKGISVRCPRGHWLRAAYLPSYTYSFHHHHRSVSNSSCGSTTQQQQQEEKNIILGNGEEVTNNDSDFIATLLSPPPSKPTLLDFVGISSAAFPPPFPSPSPSLFSKSGTERRGPRSLPSLQHYQDPEVLEADTANNSNNNIRRNSNSRNTNNCLMHYYVGQPLSPYVCSYCRADLVRVQRASAEMACASSPVVPKLDEGDSPSPPLRATPNGTAAAKPLKFLACDRCGFFMCHACALLRYEGGY